MKRPLRRCHLAFGLLVAAVPAAAAPPPARLPLRYGSACAPPPGDPGHVTIKDSPKGPVVTFERSDLGPLDTRDVNLAFISRRLFFKLRTTLELIEFQGHAEDGELEGMLSDSHGTRHISLPLDAAGRSAPCRKDDTRTGRP